MPEEFIIPIEKKYYPENNINFDLLNIGNTINSSQKAQIQASLSIFGFNDIEIGLIETLFARGYLDKIVGNEQRLIALKDLGFELNLSSIFILCNNSKEDIINSINKFERLSGKLSELKELGFQFNGESFCNIFHLYENQIDRILSFKKQFIFLKDFGVEFDLVDWEYFNFDEKVLNNLFGLGERLKLDGKIGLKISLQNLCAIKNTPKSSKKVEETKSQILAKIQAILANENQNQEDIGGIIMNLNKIYIKEINNNIFSTKEEKTKKDFIFPLSDNSNYFNPSFLDSIDEVIFEKALENIDLISKLFQKMGIISITIKDFLELSYLFDNKELLENIRALIENGLSIGLNDLKSRGALFEKLDEETIGYIIEMRTIHSLDILDDITLIVHVVANKQNVKIILENEEKYKKIAGLYQMLFGDEELLFKDGVFKENIIEILNAPNFDELEGIFQELRLYTGNKPIHDKIFYPNNLSFIMSITQVNPGSLKTFLLTYFKFNISGDFINILKNELSIRDIIGFFNTFDDEYEEEYLFIHGIYNEFILFGEAFGLTISRVVKNSAYNFNLESLLGGKSQENITSLDEMFEYLKQTGFLEGKITKDNIEEIGALINFDFTNYDGETVDAIAKVKLGNDIDTYKKIIRVLGEYMYLNDFEDNSNMQNLCLIFGKIFNSSFLRKLFSQSNRKDLFNYLLSKKVRLQDIERAYNNYNNLFTLDIDNEYYKFCLDFAIETGNYDYLSQNIETVKYLQDNGFMQKLVSGLGNIQNEGEMYEKILHIFNNITKNNKINILDTQNILDVLREILAFTGGYLTASMVKGYIEDDKSLEELLQENLEAKKEVLSGNPITHFTEATYENIFLAYRPTGTYTIETIKRNIENGNIPDLSHHLEWIHHNPEGYPMEFFERSYSLEGKQEGFILNKIDSLLLGNNLGENVFSGLNLKLFFSTATNIFSLNNGETEKNTGILTILRNIYALNNDLRINNYIQEFSGDEFSYERLSELKEIFSVVTKDSFDTVIGDEISRLNQEEQLKLWENIGKLKDKNIKSKYEEINSKDTDLQEKLSELFLWRFLEYAKTVRKYITAEMKKFKEIKGKPTRVNAILSKNVGSFFAKAGAGLCTSEDYNIWKEQRHIHLNLIDEQKQEIIGNVMLYFEPERNYLVARGFNPTIKTESAYDVNHMVDEMIRVVKEIAVQNGYINENGESLVYIPPQDYFHAVSNREKVRKRMKYIVGKVGEEIHNIKFYPKTIGDFTYNTLHRI